MSAIPLNVLINAVQAMDHAASAMNAHLSFPFEEVRAMHKARAELSIHVDAITKAMSVEVTEAAHERP